MKITPLPDVQPRPRCVAVGTFDGVHLGHREVIAGSDTVVTFDPHPTAVVAPGAAPRLLTELHRKAALVGSLGVQELVVVPFDRAFAARTAQEFIDDVLVGALQATRVSVGENFRFGHKAHGDTDLLRADDRFETRIVELLEVDGEVVSSSHIRGLVLGGAVEYAGHLLGDAFTLSGEVVHGDKRGRELGYPTANLVPDAAYVTPGHGVYAARARLTGSASSAGSANSASSAGSANSAGSAGSAGAEATVRPAAVSIGVRPTFVTGRGELIEAFLLDFDADIYGETLELAFVKRLRGEKRFDSVDALIDQMAVDVRAARALCA